MSLFQSIKDTNLAQYQNVIKISIKGPAQSQIRIQNHWHIGRPLQRPNIIQCGLTTDIRAALANKAQPEMGGGRGRGRGGKARTQRRHFKQNKENVWKRPRTDPSVENNDDNGNNNEGDPNWQPFGNQNPSFDEYYKVFTFYLTLSLYI